MNEKLRRAYEGTPGTLDLENPPSFPPDAGPQPDPDITKIKETLDRYREQMDQARTLPSVSKTQHNFENRTVVEVTDTGEITIPVHSVTAAEAAALAYHLIRILMMSGPVDVNPNPAIRETLSLLHSVASTGEIPF